MRNIVKTATKTAIAGTFLGGSLLFTAGLGLANAAPVQTPDGLVNVNVGTTTVLKGVSADEAAKASAAICGSDSANVSTLAEQVDAQGAQQIVCSGLPGGDLVLAQNASDTGESGALDHTEHAPGGAEVIEPAQGGATG
ncbi:MAG: hypothetical protein HYZ38_09295 [Mycobacterium sp.]|nr:hypothetical protein [Mycobacterium sp.]